MTGSNRLSETRAREVLAARFASAGATIETDYAFHETVRGASQDIEVLLTLDGYDHVRRIGYIYVSRSDADVVTDVDDSTESSLRALAANKTAWILLLQDDDVPNADVLERRIDAFFAQLPATS